MEVLIAWLIEDRLEWNGKNHTDTVILVLHLSFAICNLRRASGATPNACHKYSKDWLP